MADPRNFDVMTTGGVPVKHWTRGVPFEGLAQSQVRRIAELPFIHKHVAVMPDVHAGKGSTIGSVIPTKGAIIPAAVGVDLGCGMMARRMDLTANDLPDNLDGLHDAIAARIPHGRSDNGGPNDVGAWRTAVPTPVMVTWRALSDGFDRICWKHPAIEKSNNERHLGTLGTGNHFVEVCLDEEDRVWVMLHSGSRGVGNRIGSYFISKAKEEMKRWYVNLPDKDLAYLPEGSDYFDDYVEAVSWAQNYALMNRVLMMKAARDALDSFMGRLVVAMPESAVNSHHNYVAKENHFGANVWVTRKGAVRARVGDLGIIPGSMGARSFIVRGKGSSDSFHSCSHGAGRTMSRAEAKRRFSLEDHENATKGIACRKDAGVLDETPGAYKDVDAVMEAQKDLVEVVHTLRQVVCVKG